MNDEERILLAARSGAELALAGHAFDGLKEVLVEQIIETSFDQNDKRERLFVALKTLAMVREALEGAVAAGEVAKQYRDAIAVTGLTRP
jgi:hypothetical protein